MRRGPGSNGSRRHGHRTPRQPSRSSNSSLMGVVALGMLGCLAISNGRRRKPMKHEGVHGTARFQTELEIRRSGLLPQRGAASCRRLCRRLDRCERPRPLPPPRRAGALRRHCADAQRQGRRQHPADAAVMAGQLPDLRREGRALGTDRRLAGAAGRQCRHPLGTGRRRGQRRLQFPRGSAPRHAARGRRRAEHRADDLRPERRRASRARITGARPASPCCPP